MSGREVRTSRQQSETADRGRNLIGKQFVRDAAIELGAMNTIAAPISFFSK